MCPTENYRENSSLADRFGFRVRRGIETHGREFRGDNIWFAAFLDAGGTGCMRVGSCCLAGVRLGAPLSGANGSCASFDVSRRNYIGDA